MKRVLLSLVLVALMACGGFAQELERQNFAFVAWDYAGVQGVSYGAGFTLGKVSVVPTTRHTLAADPLTGETNFEGTAGVELIYWPPFLTKPRYKIGLVAAPLNADWLESQDRDLPTYFTQAIGVAGVYDVTDRFSILVAAKGTDQLFDQNSGFNGRVRVIAGGVIKL